MELLYNSDSFAVLQFDVPARDGLTRGAPDGAPAGLAPRGGYEIVDKFARKEIFLDGLLAEHFRHGVQQLVSSAGDEGLSAERLDEYIAGFTVLAQQPLHVH